MHNFCANPFLVWRLSCDACNAWHFLRIAISNLFFLGAPPYLVVHGPLVSMLNF